LDPDEKLDYVNELCNRFRKGLSAYKETKPTPSGKKRIKVVAISDTHIPFQREDFLKAIIKEHSGAEYLVITGDLLDNNLISSFPKEKEIPFAIEYSAGFELVCKLSSNFGRVILVDGNHDAGRYQREISKLNPTIKFLVKTSPLKYLADGYNFSPWGEELGQVNLPNVFYAGDLHENGWWFRIGKSIFAHRLKGMKKGTLSNATHMANWFLDRGIDFQCFVSGHSHKVGWAPMKGGRIVIDQGCLCLPMQYESDGGCNYLPQDLGYAIVEMDQNGNVNPNLDATRPVYLGTYSHP
jgi:predicted phosphodiesterase